MGSIVVLYSKEAKVVMGPYSATSDPGWKLEKDVWSTVGKGFGFTAQVRVQAQGTVKRLSVRERDAPKAGPMTAARVEEHQGAQRQQGTVNKAPSVWNKKVKEMVMPKSREVSAAQDTLVGVTWAKGQGGYMFHCTKQTGAECLQRMLVGAPAKDMQGMKEQVKVGSTVFLYTTGTREVMGPYTATSEPGLGLEEDAW